MAKSAPLTVETLAWIEAHLAHPVSDQDSAANSYRNDGLRLAEALRLAWAGQEPVPPARRLVNEAFTEIETHLAHAELAGPERAQLQRWHRWLAAAIRLLRETDAPRRARQAGP